MLCRPIALALLLGAAAATTTPMRAQNAAAGSALRTVAEESQYQRTGRYDEVERLCAAYARTWPDAVRCVEFGRTPEGRPMLALVASRAGALTPEDARQRSVPVMLMQGGIHAGESDGKDAGFLALRELLRDEAAPGALKAFVLVFVPVFNVDGHERFGRWNRPNQRGPEEMGWRTTAQNLNLNRDYAKADAPEMQAMLRLLGAWDPVLYVDLHVTDGADFEHDVSNTLEPIYVGDPGLQPAGRALLEELNGTLTTAGSLPLDFYPSLVRDDDPASGFTVAASPARFSTGYWPMHNRFALLVETHSWKNYPTRVRVTHRIIVTLADMMARQGARWRSLSRQADERAQRIGGQAVAIDFETGSHSTPIDFRGYAYTREPSAVSGRLATRYDPSRPQIWRVPLLDTVVAKTTVTAPPGGYLVPAAHAGWVGEKLALHGIRFDRLTRPLDNAAVEAFRAGTVAFSAGPFENRTTATVEGQWQPERRFVPAGSLFVPIAQPNARLVLTLLEPRSPDSFLAWGFFNSAFETKEYMEGYVAEQVAAEMLKDPEVAREFRRRLAEDAAFAASPRARLEFFYRRHPSFDERLNLYPIYRTATVPSASG
jgi:hypothetical protein